MEHQVVVQEVARGARQVGDDGALLAAEGIEQAAFAHIGPADNRHPQAIAQQLGLLPVEHQLIQRLLNVFQGGADRCSIEAGEVFFEVHACFELAELIEQLVAQCIDALLQSAIQSGHRQLSGSAAPGAHQFADGFGAGEIKASIEKRPLAEFPGQGAAGARRQDKVQQPLHRHQSAMAVELHHRFAGEAAWRPHQQQQHLIHHIAVGWIVDVAVEHPMALPALLASWLKQLAANGFSVRAADSHDGHAAGTGSHRRGDRCDGVVARRQAHGRCRLRARDQ